MTIDGLPIPRPTSDRRTERSHTFRLRAGRKLQMNVTQTGQPRQDFAPQQVINAMIVLCGVLLRARLNSAILAGELQFGYQHWTALRIGDDFLIEVDVELNSPTSGDEPHGPNDAVTRTIDSSVELALTAPLPASVHEIRIISSTGREQIKL